MSWYRQVKTLFTVSLVLFLYILWAIVGNFLFDNIVDFRIFLLSVLVVFLMQYLNEKKINKYVVTIGPALITVAGTYFIKKAFFGIDAVALILITLLFYKIEDEDINYYVYRARIKQMTYTMIALGIVLPMINMELSKSILRFYIIFIMSTVLVQREARAYSYKLKSRNRVAANIGIILAMLALSSEKVFRSLIAFVKLLYIPISFVLEKIIFVLAILIVKPLEGVVEYLRKLIELIVGKKAQNYSDIIKIKEDREILKSQGVQFPTWLNYALKIIILVVIIVIVYKLFRKHRFKSDKSKAETEQREKIQREKLKERKIVSIIKELFKPSDNRGKILHVFRKFQKVTLEKEIFKEHMTATQLANITKAFTDVKAEEGTAAGAQLYSHPLDDMKNIYNEAKFSNHQIEDDKVKSIKEKYDKVKKSIKKD